MRQRRILVVDDDPSIRSLISVALKREGLDTVTAQDGAAAMTLCRERGFDLVVLDMMMPRMSGEQFLDLLRADQDDLPRVIIVTAVPPSHLGEATPLVHAVVTKPFDLPDLVQTVLASLDGPPPRTSVHA